MVVYRPPPNVADFTNPPVDELQAVIEQEQIAQAEADPARQIDTIREAHMRRERENARNQELMRLLADGNTEVARFRLPSNVESRLQEINQQVELCYAADTIQYQELCERDHNDEEQLLSDLDEEEQDPDNMSNADSNDSSYVEREIRPAQARLMTHGEAVTLLRMIDTISPNCSRSPLPPSSRTFPYGKDSIEEVINHVFPRYTDPGQNDDARVD
uniref:Uncharacterized protein n=1 Tax=Caenorhabditis japonica TaxID=281687 RepID=A0A8R1IXQ7_CAEJA